MKLQANAEVSSQCYLDGYHLHKGPLNAVRKVTLLQSYCASESRIIDFKDEAIPWLITSGVQWILINE